MTYAVMIALDLFVEMVSWMPMSNVMMEIKSQNLVMNMVRSVKSVINAVV